MGNSGNNQMKKIKIKKVVVLAIVIVGLGLASILFFSLSDRNQSAHDSQKISQTLQDKITHVETGKDG
jgi:hypothetical protein